MNALIEKLKKNRTPYGLCTSEERECFDKTGIKNCLCYSGHFGWKPSGCDDFILATTYRIKSSYQPQPEYVDYEIKRVGDRLVITYPIPKAYQDIPIHELPSLPGFRGFWVPEQNVRIDLDYVADYHRTKSKVIARFEVGK